MANHDVHIFQKDPGNRGYNPQKVVIKVGDTITWINDGTGKHNAHRDIDPKFETGELAIGETKTVTFNQATDAAGIGYSCTPHPDMKGTIVVTT
jgi:plastocyanin